MKKYLLDYLALFLVSGLIVGLDFLTKHIVRENLPLGHIFMPELQLTEFARIIHWQNSGAAGGILSNLGNLLKIIPLIISVGVMVYFPRIAQEDRLIRLSMALFLGGAIGNLIDRVPDGFVTDFISIWKFPVFNIADLSVNLGIITLFLGLWNQEKRATRAAATSTAPDETG